MFNEFFNELAYNPGPSKGGFLFFLDWANHNLNSVVSSSDATGPLGRSLIYFNCEILPIFEGVREINKSVNLLIGLLKPPTAAECASEGLSGAKTTTSSERARRKVDDHARPVLGPAGAPLRQRPRRRAQRARTGTAGRRRLRCRSARRRSATCS